MTEQGGLEQRQTGLSLAGQDVFSSEGFICVLFLAVQMVTIIRDRVAGGLQIR